ncbi:MAG: hypothetical protein M5U09_27355 [Gammaproteobacteria bacterium]|nr:hypothetical protein [Gammaproteobacteria bacterium]
MGPLLLLLAVYVLVRAWYLDFVPLWDGVVYYHGAKAALGTPGATGSVIATEVHGHVSFLWLLLLSLPTLVDIESIVLFNAWHTLLAMVSIAAFHGILATAAGSRATPWELAWWSALFAFHPVVIGNWVNPNLDSGLMLFLLLYLYGWLRRRYLLATAAALGIIFTKEPGLLLFPSYPSQCCWRCPIGAGMCGNGHAGSHCCFRRRPSGSTRSQRRSWRVFPCSGQV